MIYANSAGRASATTDSGKKLLQKLTENQGNKEKKSSQRGEKS